MNDTTPTARLREIAQLAAELLDQHDLSRFGWYFEWDNGKRRAGCCNYRLRRISGSRHLLPKATDAEVREILLHEVAHALTQGHGHDRVWQAKLIELGGSGARTHQMETVKGRYDVVCENCGVIGNRHQLSRTWILGRRHPRCGNGKVFLADARPPVRRQSAAPRLGVAVAAQSGAPAPAGGRDCTCGCGGTTKGGRYLPGHDARHLAHEFNLVEGGFKTPAQALATLDESVSLRGKLIQRFIKAGWRYSEINLTWSR